MPQTSGIPLHIPQEYFINLKYPVNFVTIVFFLCCPGCNDWYEPQRQLCGWRGTEQKKNPDSQVPHWARYCYQLGWHGDVLASHVLQWAESFPWGPPSPPHRGPPEPQDKQGKDGTGNEGWHQFPPTPSTYLKLFLFFLPLQMLWVSIFALWCIRNDELQHGRCCL